MPCPRCGEAGGFHQAACNTYDVPNPLVYRKNDAGEWLNSNNESLPSTLGKK